VKKSMDSRFLKKILTDDEIEIVNLAQNADSALWSFWACKEAAYKVIKKSYNEDSFTPRRWSVNIKLQSMKNPEFSGNENNDCLINNIGQHNQPQTSYIEGQVIIPGRDAVYIRLFSHPSYVHCVGADSLSTLDYLSWGIDILPLREDGQDDNPSSFARQYLVCSLAGFLHLNSSDIKIRRIKKGAVLQPPSVYIGGKRAAIDVSLSHDGRFIAYAFNETR
jgi:phosphopantetheinyl transferase (holo-ACP synthase)